MDCNDVKTGMRVRVTRLGSTQGMTIKPHHLTVRRVGAIGTVQQHVPGHGGDVWFVRHENSEEVGAYVFDEFEVANG